MTFVILGRLVLTLSALLFCLVLALFIVPLVLERLTFYIPRLSLLVKEGAVRRRSIAITVGEVLGWSITVAAVYLFLYRLFPEVFRLVTVGGPAVASWIAGAVYLLFRFGRFNKTVKRKFYHSSYMHYITPEALHAYQRFIEELDDMTNEQLEEQARLASAKEIPYMHRQAVHRKMGERGILDSWTKYTQKLGPFALFALKNPGESKKQ